MEEREEAGSRDLAAREAPTAADFSEKLLLALLLLFSLVLLADLIAFGYGRDQGIYAVVADGILRGEAPYRAVWDFKPPGIFFVYAAAKFLLGSDQIAIRVLEALGLASLFPAFGILARRHLGTPNAGIVAAVVAIFAYVPLEFWHTAQPEGFGGILLAWALVCAGAGTRAGRLAAAFLFACAALLKPPLGGGLLVCFGWELLRRRRWREHSGWWDAFGEPALDYALGFALPIAAVALYFALEGALGDLYEALFVFAPHYVAMDAGLSKLPEQAFRTLLEWLLMWTPYNTVGLVAFIALPRLDAREREGAAIVLGVVAVLLLGVVLQAKFFFYHYAAAHLLTGCIAGWGYWKTWLWVRGSRVRWALPVCVVLALHFGWPLMNPSLQHFWHGLDTRMRVISRPEAWVSTRDQLGAHNARVNRLTAQWIAANTPPGSTLYVWGFEPVIYDLARRRPASRYIYNAPQRSRWSRDASRLILMEELERNRPAAIVVTSQDSMFPVTGNSADSAEVLQGFPELLALLDAEYEPAWSHETVLVLRRRE